MRRIRMTDRKRLICEANITPLVDACLVLLVIFMISSPFIINQAVNIALPRTLSAAEFSQDDEMGIYVVFDQESKKTTYSTAEKKSASLDEIRAAINEKLKDRKNKTVRIYSDGNVPMKKVIELTDLILASGGRIQIITEYGQPESR